MSNQILDKVKKLLSLAKSDNANESDLALQKATELAAEHGIDLAVAALSGSGVEEKFEPVQEVVDFGKKKSSLQKYINWILMAHFNVQIVNSGRRRWDNVRMSVIGHKPDVEMALYVNDYLDSEFDRRWWRYQFANKLSAKEKATFLYGCYTGLDAKLRHAKEAAEKAKFNELPETIRSSAQNKYALMVVTHKELVEDFMYQCFPSMRKGYTPRISLSNNDRVRHDGFTEGYSMNINKPITGSKALC